MTDLSRVDALFGKRRIIDIDRHFAATIAELAGDGSDLLALAAAILSSHTRDGHTCIDLDEIAGRPWSGKMGADIDDPILPERDEWLRSLAGKSKAVASGGAAGNKLFVLDDTNRLYFSRMWRREQFVSARLRELAARETTTTGALEAALDELFTNDVREHLPRKAAHIAASRHLCCISGGPGTGKTTTVAKIIMALMKSGQAEVSDIAFAAPTGKAAARLQESTRESLRDMPGADCTPEEHAVEVSTIHRWLLKNEAERGLAKVLIIDEASMVDIHQMDRVLNALPPEARLILLGDSHQLASVEPGSVFADICHAAKDTTSPLGHCVINLEHNWRFDKESGIGHLADAINRGDASATTSALDNPAENSVQIKKLEGAAALDNLAKQFTQCHYAPMVKKFRSLRGVEQLSSSHDHPFKGFMALCSHNRSASGSQRFNARVEQHLRASGLISGHQEFYIGRPIIVTRNDHGVGLVNGDTGIVVNMGGGTAKVWFPDLPEPNGEPRLVTPQRLPPHESFYALTVHRSQGSEYDEVAVIPGPADSPVNTRELLYTAVTRARKKVVIHGTRDGVKAAVERETARGSGLKDALL